VTFPDAITLARSGAITGILYVLRRIVSRWRWWPPKILKARRVGDPGARRCLSRIVLQFMDAVREPKKNFLALLVFAGREILCAISFLLLC
jgi:hypothetical protein